MTAGWLSGTSITLLIAFQAGHLVGPRGFFLFFSFFFFSLLGLFQSTSQAGKVLEMMASLTCCDRDPGIADAELQPTHHQWFGWQVELNWRVIVFRYDSGVEAEPFLAGQVAVTIYCLSPSAQCLLPAARCPLPVLQYVSNPEPHVMIQIVPR